MEFTKIRLSKQGTLVATYKNNDGDTVNFVGANVVHKDMREAMKALVPHLALLTEQREAYGKTLADLRAQSITDEGDNAYKRLSVDCVSFSDKENKIAIGGTRILTKAGIITISTSVTDLEDTEAYEGVNELAVDIDAVKYEAEQYITNKKWGVVQASIEFEDINPFNGVKAEDAPEVEAPKKKSKKAKKVA